MESDKKQKFLDLTDEDCKNFEHRYDKDGKIVYVHGPCLVDERPYIEAGPAYGGPYLIEDRKPSLCDIFLKEVGPNKIRIISLLRTPIDVWSGGHHKTTKQLTLAETKKLAETPLSLIYEDISYFDAQEIKKKFEMCGAKIEIVVTEYDY
jgi:ribosomal protein L7/L12